MNHGHKTIGIFLLIAMILLIAGPAGSATTEYFDHATFLAGSGNLTVVDFNSLTPGNNALSGNEFIAQGLTIVQRDGLPTNVFGAGQNIWFYPANFNSLYGISSSCGVGIVSDQSDNFDFIFANPVHAAGLWIGNIHPGTTEVQFIASDNTVLAGEIIDINHTGVLFGGASNWNNRVFYGIHTDLFIERIRTVEPAGDGDRTVYDDVAFSSAPVPATIWLLGSGIAALAALRRKYKNNTRSRC
jgi:hypothetical protein